MKLKEKNRIRQRGGKAELNWKLCFVLLVRCPVNYCKLNVLN